MRTPPAETCAHKGHGAVARVPIAADRFVMFNGGVDDGQLGRAKSLHRAVGIVANAASSAVSDKWWAAEPASPVCTVAVAADGLVVFDDAVVDESHRS